MSAKKKTIIIAVIAVLVVAFIAVAFLATHQLLLLLGQLGHLLEDTGRDVLPPGLAGAFATFQLRVLLDHMLPELVLPLHKVLAVADDLFRAQPPVSSQRYKAEVQVGRFLVHVDNSREKGIRALSALQKFQGVRKVRPDLPVGLILEKLRVCEAQRNNESPSGAFK